MLLLDSKPPEMHSEVRTAYIAPMVNMPIIGSQDKRVGITMGIQWAHPEKRLTFNGHRLYLVFESQLSFSYGGGWNRRPRDKAWAIASLGLARYEVIGPSKRGFFYELGWGLHLANESTFDLDSRLNSTPTLGGGIIFDRAGTTYQLGLRWYHISNAGTVGHNQGQNQLLLQIGVRF